MFSKSLFILMFANLFNQTYNLAQIQCPRWLPGTNRPLPQGVTLSPDLELQNRVRCYCEVVKVKEAECLALQIPGGICRERTRAWVEDNLRLENGYQLVNGLAPVPPRLDRMISVEP